MSVFFAAILPVILLFCGLSLDVGLLELRKLQMQSAADAAAIAAELEWERGTGNWVAQAQADAGVNGFTNGANNVTVAAVNPATAGDYAGYYDAIQVTVTQKVQTIFMGALSGGAVTMSATAVSLIPPCSFYTGLIATTNATPFWIKNSGASMTTNCPLYIGTGLEVDSGATLSAGAENVTGSAGPSILTGTVSPAPNFSQPVATDPLASIVSPSFSSCSQTSYSLSSGTATLTPGTYCKGIQLTSSTVTLNPGLYILTGASDWKGSTVTGTGVTFFLTQGGGGSFGTFKIEQSSTISISAPTDSSHGGIANVLLMNDRAWVDTGHNEDFQCSASTIAGDGIWYTTGTGLYFNSCPVSAPHYLGMVTDNLYDSHSALTVSSDYSNVTTGNPFRTRGVLVQ
jgi:hypothetical protein